jgi:hypothetical protein
MQTITAIDYRVAFAVNDKIQKGWQPYKELIVCVTSENIYYIQAIVKYKE